MEEKSSTPPPPGFAPLSMSIPTPTQTLHTISNLSHPVARPDQIVSRDLDKVVQDVQKNSEADSIVSKSVEEKPNHRVLKIIPAPDPSPSTAQTLLETSIPSAQSSSTSLPTPSNSLKPSKPSSPPIPSIPIETATSLSTDSLHMSSSPSPSSASKRIQKKRAENQVLSSSSTTSLPPPPVEEEIQVAPILSRKTKKKKLPKVIPTKPVTTAVPVTAPVTEKRATEEKADAKLSRSSSVEESLEKIHVSPTPSPEPALDLNSVESNSATADSKELTQVFESLVTHLREMDIDGLDVRVSQLPDSSQVKGIFTIMSRILEPFCELIKKPRDQASSQPSSGENVVESIVGAVISVYRTSLQIRKGIEGKIEYIRAHHGKKKIKKMVGEWNPCLEKAGELEKASLEILKFCHEEKVSESNMQTPPTFSVDSVEELYLKPMTSITSPVPSPPALSPPPQLSVEQYLEELLTAVHDFVYVPQLRESAAASTTPFDQSVLEDESRRRPWITLAAATGLDPKNFDITQQITLVNALQAHFPSPRDLVALIVENPTDPRLRFESLIMKPPTGPPSNMVDKKKTIPELEAKVSELEKRLLQHRLHERALESKLESIKARNDEWRDEVIEMLGLRAVVTNESGDVLDDDVDGDWIDDDDD